MFSFECWEVFNSVLLRYVFGLKIWCHFFFQSFQEASSYSSRVLLFDAQWKTALQLSIEKRSKVYKKLLPHLNILSYAEWSSLPQHNSVPIGTDTIKDYSKTSKCSCQEHITHVYCSLAAAHRHQSTCHWCCVCYSSCCKIGQMHFYLFVHDGVTSRCSSRRFECYTASLHQWIV